MVTITMDNCVRKLDAPSAMICFSSLQSSRKLLRDMRKDRLLVR